MFNIKKALKLILIFLVFCILCLFVPISYSTSVAEGYVEKHISGQSIQLPNQSHSEILFNPTVVVFSESSTTLRANFITLKRDFILFWSMEKVGFYDAIKTGDNDLQKLKDAVLNGDLTKGDNFDQEAFNKGVAGVVTDPFLSPGAISQSIQSPQGGNKVEIRNGIIPNTNELWVNGKATAIKNVSSLDFDDLGNTIYYTQYKMITEVELHPEPMLVSLNMYNIDLGKNEVLHTFDGGEISIVRSSNIHLAVMVDGQKLFLFNNNKFNQSVEIPWEDDLPIKTLVSVDSQKAVLQSLSLSNEKSQNVLYEFYFESKNFIKK